jgi:hypothetical protein
MIDYLRVLLSGPDNKTPDPARVLWLAFSIAFIGFSAFWVYHNPDKFDPQNFALGAGCLLAGGGAGVGLKSHTEPKPE